MNEQTKLSVLWGESWCGVTNWFGCLCAHEWKNEHACFPLLLQLLQSVSSNPLSASFPFSTVIFFPILLTSSFTALRCYNLNLSHLSASIFPPSSLQDELQELEGVPGLAVLPVPAHHWHLCPGALGKVHFQLHPLLRHRHGDLHLICLCAHSHTPCTGVFLWDLWWPAWEHHDPHELTGGGSMEVKRQWMSGLAWVPKLFPITQLVRSWSTLSFYLHHVHPKQRSVTSANQDWKHEDFNGVIWRAEP